jgi:hypothetical protein
MRGQKTGLKQLDLEENRFSTKQKLSHKQAKNQIKEFASKQGKVAEPRTGALQKAKSEANEVLDSIVRKNAQGDNNYKILFKYNSDKSVASETYYYWDGFSSSWVKNSTEEFAYNSNGNVISAIYLYFDIQSGMIAGGYKSEYILDSNGNVTTWTSYTRDQGTDGWIPDYKTETSYDNLGQPEAVHLLCMGGWRRLDLR